MLTRFFSRQYRRCRSGPLASAQRSMRVALGLVFEERHAVAAGCLHEIEVEPDDLARAERLAAAKVIGEQSRILIGAAMDGAAAPIEPEDQRRAFDGAEHDGDPAVGQQMGRRLVAAAGAVEIAGRVVADDAETVGRARRDVDARARRRRSR